MISFCSLRTRTRLFAGVGVLGQLSPLYSGTQAPNVVALARLPTLRVAATAEVKRVLLYLLARLWVESDLAYRYPAIVAGVVTLETGVVSLYGVVLLLSGWVRVGCARLSSVHSSVPTFLWAGLRGVAAPAGPFLYLTCSLYRSFVVCTPFVCRLW